MRTPENIEPKVTVMRASFQPPLVTPLFSRRELAVMIAGGIVANVLVAGIALLMLVTEWP
jgi:hypothetical protein